MPYNQSQDPYSQGGQYPPMGYNQYGSQSQMPPQQMGTGGAYGSPMMMYPAKNGVATAALVLGILAQCLFLITVFLSIAGPDTAGVVMATGLLGMATPVFGIVAFIVGIIGTSKSGSLIGAGKGKSIAGLVMGLLAAITMMGVFAFGLYAMQSDPSLLTDDDDQVMTPPTLPEDDTTTGTGNEDKTTGSTGTGESSGSPSQTSATDGLTAEQLESMLSGIVWDCHVDSGEIGSKFTFDTVNKTYAYWKGDADPATQTGDHIAGHYEIYFDETAYDYLDGMLGAGRGDSARNQLESVAQSRGESVHYFLLRCRPETEIIGGIESPSELSPDGDGFVPWDGIWMPQSKHIQITNGNTGNRYDMYDSSVPIDQRETAMTRLRDVVQQGLDNESE